MSFVSSLFSPIAIWITETRSHVACTSASAQPLLADVLGVGPLGPLLHGFFGGERSWISRGAADTPLLGTLLAPKQWLRETLDARLHNLPKLQE